MTEQTAVINNIPLVDGEKQRTVEHTLYYELCSYIYMNKARRPPLAGGGRTQGVHIRLYEI